MVKYLLNDYNVVAWYLVLNAHIALDSCKNQKSFIQRMYRELEYIDNMITHVHAQLQSNEEGHYISSSHAI